VQSSTRTVHPSVRPSVRPSIPTDKPTVRAARQRPPPPHTNPKLSPTAQPQRTTSIPTKRPAHFLSSQPAAEPPKPSPIVPSYIHTQHKTGITSHTNHISGALYSTAPLAVRSLFFFLYLFFLFFFFSFFSNQWGSADNYKFHKVMVIITRNGAAVKKVGGL